MRRTLTALVCLAIPLAAACGGTSTHASNAGTSPAPPASLAQARSDAGTSNTNPPHFSGSSGSSWCDFARQVDDSTKMREDFSKDPKSWLQTANSLLARAESEAPSAISNDMHTLVEGIKVLTKALADVNYDFTKITPAQVSSLENPNMVAASQHIVAYDQVCGVKD